MNPADRKVKNVTGRPLEHCSACIDGWVELAGTVTVGGRTYSRGLAPCRWCELGDARFTHHSQRWTPESEFDGTEIVPPTPPGRNFRPDADFLRERAAAGCSIDSLKAMFDRRIWPSEWPTSAPVPPVQPMPSLGDDPAEVARKVQAARIAAQQVESELQEPISAVQAPAQELEDLPF